MNKLASAMHDATHLVPGVPAHSDTSAIRRPHRTGDSGPRNQGRRLQAHSRPRGNQPRILVRWQDWIARMVGQSNTRP
jgi:hypothetical protein